MTSPARRHFERARAAKEAANRSSGQAMEGDQHQLMMATLVEDRRRLKSIQSVERKVETKRSLLPQYDAYVQGALEADSGAQDEVLMYVMIWRFDIGDLAGGLEIAEYALRHGLTPPDQYQRNAASIVAEEVATQALNELGKDDADVESLIGYLKHVEKLTQDADMHDQVRAKLHKAIGYAQRARGDSDQGNEHLEESLNHLRRALELDDRIGVKKDIERLERDLKKAASGNS